MGKTIDIKEVVKKAGLDYKEVAAELFPLNAYPWNALNRVRKREAFLDEVQISKLASLTGFTISELFGETSWSSFSKGGVLFFKNDQFKAELDTKTWITKIFHNESLFHEEVIHSGLIPLSEYLAKLDELISNQLNKE